MLSTIFYRPCPSGKTNAYELNNVYKIINFIGKIVFIVKGSCVDSLF